MEIGGKTRAVRAHTLVRAFPLAFFTIEQKTELPYIPFIFEGRRDSVKISLSRIKFIQTKLKYVVPINKLE